jgi:transposase-like protein
VAERLAGQACDESQTPEARSESVELREARKRIRLLEQENEVLCRAAAYLGQANLAEGCCTRSYARSGVTGSLSRSATLGRLKLAEIKKLRKEVADRQRTIEILKAANTYFREGGRRPFEVMIRVVDEHCDTWPVSTICASIELIKRTYYAAKSRPLSARSVSDEAHKIKIRAVWVTNYSCYGPRRVHEALRRAGYEIARCTVERLMPGMGIGGVVRARSATRPLPTTPQRSHRARRPPVRGNATQRAVGGRHHLGVDLARLAVRRVRVRRVLAGHRRLADRRPPLHRSGPRRLRRWPLHDETSPTATSCTTATPAAKPGSMGRRNTPPTPSAPTETHCTRPGVAYPSPGRIERELEAT